MESCRRSLFWVSQSNWCALLRFALSVNLRLHGFSGGWGIKSRSKRDLSESSRQHRAEMLSSNWKERKHGLLMCLFFCILLTRMCKDKAGLRGLYLRKKTQKGLEAANCNPALSWWLNPIWGLVMSQCPRVLCFSEKKSTSSTWLKGFWEKLRVKYDRKLNFYIPMYSGNPFSLNS